MAVSASSTASSMDVDLANDASQDIINRLADILSSLRMQKEQLELRYSNSSDPLFATYSSSVSATILGVPDKPEPSLKALEELIDIGKDAWNVLRTYEDAGKQKNKQQKKRVFDKYMNISLVYIGVGLERRNITNFSELSTYLRDERSEFPARMGHVW